MRVLVLNSERWKDMGIARALDGAPGISPVLERDLGDQTWSKSQASVVLVSDVSIRTDASRSFYAIRRKFPKARILVHGEETNPNAIASFMTDGADGYFTLSLGEDNLVKAVQTVARGATWVPRAAITSMVEQFRSATSAPAPLTPPEMALVRMLDQGLSNKEMAAQLNVAEVTVKMRLGRLYRRFGVNTRVQLLSYAVRNGLLPRH
jgi:DNA-binding NarL/FixJ family response regulator